jgi:hypothetical protein
MISYDIFMDQASFSRMKGRTAEGQCWHSLRWYQPAFGLIANTSFPRTPGRRKRGSASELRWDVKIAPLRFTQIYVAHNVHVEKCLQTISQ